MTAVCDGLYCLLLGWEHSPESISLAGGSATQVLRLPVIGILVHAPVGWVLLETGMDPGTCEDPETGGVVYNAGAPEFETAEPVPDALRAHGLDVDDLALAAVSHLHIDHAGGLRHLAGRVPVAAQRRELDFAFGPAGLAEAYVRGDYDAPTIEWRELDGDGQLTPGIDVLSTPGHTPGHMSYRVNMAKSGPWLFAVDAIDLQRGIDEDVEIGWSADPADASARRASHDRLVALAAEQGARLVPGHCPVTWPPLAARTDGFR
ncbi:MAG: N-acyl homoserine lactone hydrolase [Solirubrobacteraceae bacterium]|nr:N-acyl homoserine lactone hydrolase [Solirubrobacteraceae bacterium]